MEGDAWREAVSWAIRKRGTRSPSRLTLLPPSSSGRMGNSRRPGAPPCPVFPAASSVPVPPPSSAVPVPPPSSAVPVPHPSHSVPVPHPSFVLVLCIPFVNPSTFLTQSLPSRRGFPHALSLSAPQACRAQVLSDSPRAQAPSDISITDACIARMVNVRRVTMRPHATHGGA
eukprot:356260-Chlamydomonas_euryale.AAC.1